MSANQGTGTQNRSKSRRTLLASSLFAIVLVGVALLYLSQRMRATDWRAFEDSTQTYELRRLLDWDGRVVVEVVHFSVLDVVHGTTSLLQLPEAKEIDDLASGRPDKPLALCRGDRGSFLLEKREGAWSRRELPEPVRRSAEPMQLAADRDTAVVIGKDGIARVELDKDAAVWLPWPSGPKKFWATRHRLLVGTNLFSGTDLGEFGGELNRVDIRTGETDKVFLHTDGQGLPVRSLIQRPDGTTWVLEGLAHGILRYGRLHQAYDGICTLFCSSCENQKLNWDLPRAAFDPSAVNWNLPPAALEALAFDSQGRQIVLSGNLGLARYENGTWTRLTPHWPEYLAVNTLLMTGDDQAIIGTYRAGIMLLDLRSGRARHVMITEE